MVFDKPGTLTEGRLGVTSTLLLGAGALYAMGVLFTPALGAVLMSASTVIVAVNARLLRLNVASGKEASEAEASSQAHPATADDQLAGQTPTGEQA